MSKRNEIVAGAVILILAAAAVVLTRPKTSGVPAAPASPSAASAVLAAECVSQPTTLENGRKEYPIAEKYEHLPWLGQLFTADDCGSARLHEVVGGPDAQYPWGSRLNIKPGEAGTDIPLIEIGYECSVDNGGPKETDMYLNETCRLEKTVPVRELLKIKPWADSISSDDCTLCG